MTEARETCDQWAIVELMGHRRLGGMVTEVERFGTKMLRIDIPPAEEDGQTLTQFYSGSSLYGLTIVDEETARGIARANQQRPVEPWSARRMLQLQDNAARENDALELDEEAFLESVG